MMDEMKTIKSILEKLVSYIKVEQVGFSKDSEILNTVKSRLEGIIDGMAIH